MQAPIAKKIPHLLTQHGQQRQDDYYWMRDDQRQNPEVLEHLRAENAYCDAQLAASSARQEQIFSELKARIKKDDNTVPVRDGHYWYHSEVSGDDEYARHYRASSFSGDNKTLLLDVNALAAGHEFYDLADMTVSPNEQLLAYCEDTSGRRIYQVRIKDLQSGELLDDVLHECEGQVVWANDNRTLYYVKKDPQTLLGFQVFRHRLGSAQNDDELVYEEQDRSFYMGLGKSRDESLIFIDLEATETSHTYVLDADDPQAQPQPLMPREMGHLYDVDKLGEHFYIITNRAAKNFRLMQADATTIADPNAWRELIAHRDNVLLEGVDLFNGHWLVTERELGQIRFVVYQHQQGKMQGEGHILGFSDPCYYAGVGVNPEPDVSSVRIYYSSLTTPGSLYEFDLNTLERKLLKQQQVLGEFNAAHYQSERLMITARDGVQVPVSLVYRRDTFNKDGSNPLLQYGYGAYGITIDPSFSSSILSLLDRGFVYAIAHIRGSEMLGRAWYEAGKLAQKQNTFNDFIDVTQALVAQGYGAADKIFASGGSAGGLLMGAVVNQAPHLYRAIGCHVPFLDVLTTMLDTSIPLTTNEYDEWGNPNHEQDYRTIAAYSPYDNIRAQAYPHILVTTGLHDSQVQYWEPMKWVAKLREYKTDDHLLLFKTDLESGHGGASGRFKSLEEKALEFNFFLTTLDYEN
ncbi:MULTISPECIES: S9 family peptidase [unclassified Pseudoalteromonas]|uniref:S9 family peptidase n=1 Tax=unclassified Pseudoalteromonas TaxID=194690 RepID=UPI001F3F6F1E|nr:S9 family peptidase [Pseudoalteromonas sp. T1lg75]